MACIVQGISQEILSAILQRIFLLAYRRSCRATVRAGSLLHIILDRRCSRHRTSRNASASTLREMESKNPF
ncbi:hypothetical protein ACH3XW_13730 [Acanthocheilonema viteae]